MILAAVFIEDEETTGSGITYNLGGKYNYKTRFGNGPVEIIRFLKQNYIKNFFDQGKVITEISAIVGKNGCGKTTLIKNIIEFLNDRYKSGFLIFEKGHKVIIHNYNWNTRPNCVNFSYKVEPDLSFESIYYSPYLDHKLPMAGIDISADRYLSQDLVNIDSTYDANKKVIISERLKRENYKRFINFQRSSVATSINKRYSLLSDKLFKVVFTRHKINATTQGISFKNTPRDFRSLLNSIFLDIRREYDSFSKISLGGPTGYNEDKKKFKNFLLMDAFCLIVTLLETHSFKKDYGRMDDSGKAKHIEVSDLSPYMKFLYFLENHSFLTIDKNVLPNKEIKNILEFLFNYIESDDFTKDEGNVLNWNSYSLFFKEKALNELLDLNEELLAAIPNYFLKVNDEQDTIVQSYSHLQTFVNPIFAERALSSGETAMLSFYSKLYDFFNTNLSRNKSLIKKSHYILFLDEVDMGYHPAWKKSFVATLIEFSKDFFKKNDCTAQIIFSTHDPISLSDIPNYNILYLNRNKGKTFVLEAGDRPEKSFAANVSDLLADSFFLDDELIGDFALSKINETIKWINSNVNKKGDIVIEDYEHYKNIIAIIEEPVLKRKLMEMLYEVKPDNQFIQAMIEKETEYLQRLLKR
ncbi:hypothetical protein BBFL7_00848 [Flavobacteria bacterium BBFL7]|nr:hypothetical protein BBFL7_00848 [Flavobacteria bacterium BBFL7]